ncbi:MULTISPECIES: putative quinol monooxygenase [unclassified Variovorax]|uniref:putative quinol monooxygenase n=1 Tax=unclassified Variovorax TaxID=663243 RepID=UPI002578EC87|nr:MULTISPECIES: putative quinol monooxygenase [unclassified Variovorax]MDM0091050.1 putative quinol monooxygenase [Variovorax sp. J22G40]MDM0148948.1 putative quinol monooxygenase [Variovorax sp. J2P1-31]
MTHALLVDFQIQPAQAEAFAEAIAHNAQRSLGDEPGCSRFDVCRDPQDPGAFFLYELYDDPAAIQAHLASPHFLAFDALTRDWVVRKAVRTHVLAEAA